MTGFFLIRIVLAVGFSQYFFEECEYVKGTQCPYDTVPDRGCGIDVEGLVQGQMGSGVTLIDNVQYPYVVSLQFLKCGNHAQGTGCYEHFCGGTMIAPNLILTAAHCFDIYKSKILRTRLDGLQFYTPSKDLYAAISPPCRHLGNGKYGRFAVNNIFILPDYYSAEQKDVPLNDVAIVDLIRNKKRQFYQGPLVEVVGEETTGNDTEAQVLGYGQVQPQHVGKYIVYPLHGGKLKLQTRAFCEGYLQNYDAQSSSKLNYTNMMCYWNRKADACGGDSGGPLLNNQGIQIGLVSWGPGSSCLDDDAAQAPGVYVRLTFFAKWIQQVVWTLSVEVAPAHGEAAAPSPISVEQIEEAKALSAFKNSLKNSSNLSSWSGTNACSNWLGISCSNGRVIDISLGETIYNLDDVSKNQRRTPFVQNIQTSIPDEWSILDKLQRVQFGNTGITGLLPPWLSKMQDLMVFDADNGKLQGTLPVEYSTLSNLRLFYAKGNGLEGPLPVQYSTLASLQYVSLWDNNLTGTLPQQYSKFVNLVNLYLERNELSGSVPPQYTSWGSTPYIILFPQQGDLLCLDKNHESIVDDANIIFC